MFNNKYLVMHKVQVHNKAISYLVKLVDYIPVQTDEPYTK